MIFYLKPGEINFPDPSLAEEDGLLAIGGDLSTERLVLAYQNGIFPWFSEDDPICWFSPHERCVIFPEKIRVSRSMEKLFRSHRYRITHNLDFASVMEHCAAIPRPGQEGTWITEEMRDAYNKLHHQGCAHSIEVCNRDGVLTGGMYGVQVGRVFCGESMFSKENNTSKAAMIWACRNLDICLLDCQMPNSHLMSLGAEMITQKNFLDILNV